MMPHEPAKSNSDNRQALGISLLYALFGSLWIAASDRLLGLIGGSDPDRVVFLSSIKGLLFIATTSGLLYLLLRHRQTSAADDLCPETGHNTPEKAPLLLIFTTLSLLIPSLSLLVFHLYPVRGEDPEKLARLVFWVTMLTMVVSAAVVAALLLLWRQRRLSRHFAGLAVQAREALEERKRSEAILRESEERYRALNERFRIIFEGAIDGILLADAQTRMFVTGNPAILRMLGYRPEELSELGVRDIHPAKNLPQVLEQFGKQLSGELKTSTSVPVQRKDGSIFHADISASPVQLNGHDYLLGIFRDVSERRLIEERLRLHIAALAGSRDALVITDLQPKILAVNPAFTAITGYSEEEVLGLNPRILNSGHHDRTFFERMWSELLSEGYWQGEIWNRRKDGETYPEWLSINTVRDEHGKPTHYVAMATDLSQLRRNEEQLQHLAHFDPLTGLPNRLLLEARLQHTLERTHRQGQLAGVLSIDLDHFKTINDSLGHAAGDELLIAVSKRFQSRLREEDTLSRLFGNQFVLVLEMLKDCREAEQIARWIHSILEAPFILSDGHETYVRASIGISLCPQDGHSSTDLLHKADAALHQAKAQGGNQICYYTSEMNARALAGLEMEAALRRALDQDELLLYYQPKVDLKSGAIKGVEALVRWQRPDHGLIQPMAFIPIAEKSGLIEAIGSWVLEEACRQLKAWRDAGLPEIRMAVNVSTQQLCSKFLERTIPALLGHYEVEARRLTLEITESMLMENPEDALERIKELKRIGVRISLDDFGTGYSSLAYLSRFPIDEMKIDRSFIRGVITDPGAATIATSIIALARRMRIRVVAEGVETVAQLGYVRQNGCDQMQGYLFSKPVPAEEIAQMLLEAKSLPGPEKAPTRPALLLVDDEPDILAILKRLLADENYHLLTATNAFEALEIMATQPVQVILSDQTMPQMTGTELLSRVKVLYPDTVRMVLSGNSTLDTVLQAVNEGALYKFIGKPWDSDELLAHIRDAFRYHEQITRPRDQGD